MFRYIFACFLLCLVASQPSNYNESISAKMINLATATFNIKTDNDKTYCPICYPDFELAEIVTDGDYLGMIGYDPKIDALMIAFRGSDTVSNWILNFMVSQTPYPNPKKCSRCQIHLGFRYGYSSLIKAGIQKSIEKQLKKHQGCKVIFTGHSLGGALANYASIRFTQKDYSQNHKVLCYTSGQPRVGNQQYVKYHNKKIPDNFRVTYLNDPIPNLPPRDAFPFRHGGIQIWYEKDMKKIKKWCKGDSSSCINSISQGNFEDHMPTHYYELYKRYRKLGK